MKPVERNTLVQATGGRALQGLDGAPVTAIFTDTRKPAAGGLFVALVGERFDAHDFIGQAVGDGATGVVVSNPDKVPADLPGDVLVLLVDDTREALRRLAVTMRGRSKAKVVAVTGSVGKTTVKDMIAAALADFGKVGKTFGNYNNDIGLPLTLFGFDGDERFLVLELGMSAPGEITALTRIAMPTVGVVTAVAAAHLAFFDSVDAIADAKAELYATLPPGARGVANADDPRVLVRARTLRPRGLTTYGTAPDAVVRLSDVNLSAKGLTATVTVGDASATVNLPALGRHNALNAAGALAAVHALGLDVARAADSLSRRYQPAPHRLAVVPSVAGLTVLDDAYNANPASTRAALETLRDVAADAPRRGAVLGSMLELGPTSADLHRDIGAAAVACGVDWLAATGPFADAIAQGARAAGLTDVRTAADALELADDVRAFAAEGRWLLLKGSRGGRLERLLDVLASPSASSDPAEEVA